jgi:hypothetical protein
VALLLGNACDNVGEEGADYRVGVDHARRMRLRREPRSHHTRSPSAGRRALEDADAAGLWIGGGAAALVLTGRSHRATNSAPAELLMHVEL